MKTTEFKSTLIANFCRLHPDLSRLFPKMMLRKLINIFYNLGLEILKDRLIHGESVKLEGLGKFVPKLCIGYSGVNNLTSKPIEVKPRIRVRFISSTVMNTKITENVDFDFLNGFG